VSDRASSSRWSFDLLQEEFLSAPIHSPLCGRLIGPSAGSFEAEDTRRDRKACVEATRSAVARHPSDGAAKTISQSALGERVS
jgi:hypothetical protein